MKEEEMMGLFEEKKEEEKKEEERREGEENWEEEGWIRRDRGEKRREGRKEDITVVSYIGDDREHYGRGF